jgi:PAS domain S-box-containing protein
VLLGNAIASIEEKDKERVTTAIRQGLLFSTGGLYDIEYSIIRPATKKEIIVRAKGRTWFGEDKIAYRFTGTLQDVSEQAKIRQQVEQSEKEFRQLTDSLPEMIWTTKKKGEQTFASKRWKEFTGIDPYDLQSFKEIVHPDDLDSITQTWARCLQSGEKYKIETRLKHSSGEYQWFFANGEPIKNDTGEIEKWLGTFVNINERKKTEQILINTFNRIEESEKQYRNLAERLNIVIGAGELGTWNLGTEFNNGRNNLF